MAKPLTDTEVYDLLHKALVVITHARGESELADTALKAVRLRIIECQGAILMRMEGRLKGMPE